MKLEEILAKDLVRTVVDDYRGMCFWSLAEDFRPSNERELEIVAENLERYGDMKAYRLAGKIRSWLSQLSRQAS